MSSQLVDINADGYNDILAGSFEGVPQLILGGKDGFAKPEQIKDGNGDTVLIADFWNYETEEWDKTDRAESEGHCTSVSAVDWDDDGDLDLLLGDYYGGRLFLRLNDGSKTEPSFSATNVAVEADGEPLVIEKGLAAPRVVDWDSDGLFDILCGGSKGGVYFFRNIGEKTAPKFAAAEALIKPVKDPSNSFIKRVPSKDGNPMLPGSSYHIEPFDYDGDGDLDLLVGARCSWLTGPVKELTEEQQARKKEVQGEMQEFIKKISEMAQKAETKEERAELVQSEEYQELMTEYRKLVEEADQYDTEPTADGDFVWLFRRK